MEEESASSSVELESPTLAEADPAAPPDYFEDLAGENQRLREEICRIRQRRRHVRHVRRRKESLLAALHLEGNASLLRQEQALLGYVSVVRRKAEVDAQLRHSQAWHALADCFPISTMGAYGTINGLRLGSEAPVLETGNVDSMVSSSEAALLSSLPAPHAASDANFDPRRGHRDSGALPSHHSAAAASSSSSSSAPLGAGVSSRVPWSEVNAALGQVALLLVVMRERPHSGIAFRHEIHPMGSASKIVAGRADGGGGGGAASSLKSAVAGGRGWTYNLHSDDSFQFFGKRNFNSALTSLLECVADAAACVRERDRTISLPYEMVPPEATIGGLSFSYSPTPEWTRACKYLLTNLKHLMTYKVLSLTFFRPSNGHGEDQDPTDAG